MKLNQETLNQHYEFINTNQSVRNVSNNRQTFIGYICTYFVCSNLSCGIALSFVIYIFLEK